MAFLFRLNKTDVRLKLLLFYRNFNFDKKAESWLNIKRVIEKMKRLKKNSLEPSRNIELNCKTEH